ncbi:MAG: hypothetical protein K0R82_16 [Flavipsychrobacter sp.]|jgi:hypothetical protein|nr:hypothetical protein [Flavipsychrobacter sp.]
MAKASKTATTKKPKPTDAEQVSEYMSQLEHPFKTEIEALRTIITNASSKLQERVKWNAPSYHYNGYDMAAFHPREQKFVHIVFVFHNGTMVESDGLLEGDYKDRRMAKFYSMEDIKAKKAALEKAVNEWVRLHE